MDRSGHTVTKYLINEKTQTAIGSKLFKKLNHVSNALYEIEIAKGENEHKEQFPVGFFIFQFAKLRTLTHLFTNFFDVNMFEELEMDTDSLYLVLAEKELEDCFRPEKKADWERVRSKDCTDRFTADAVANFFPPMVL